MQFSEIAGQEAIKRKLIQTVLDHRVSHAQLFFGPEGSEKLALAIAYAQFISCTNKRFPVNDSPDLPDSCGTCPSCVKYRKLIHPDLHFIYPVATTKRVTKKPKSRDFIDEWRKFLTGNDYHVTLHEWFEHIGIENKQGIINADDCMEIISTLSYKSYESEYKVMILWMVEKLYYSAAPKILKILEEPPEKTLFILISEDPELIISTIRSRTLLIKIPKITEGDLTRYLGAKHGMNEKEAASVARRSGGNLKLALNKLQQTEDEKYNFITFQKWMRLCFAKDIQGLIGFSGEISKIGRENQKNLLQYALGVIRSCGSLNFGTGDAPASTGDELEFIRKISPYISSSNIIPFTDLFNNAIYHIERNAYPQALFLDVSLRALRLFESAPKKIARKRAES
jgi:DNA polymerase III subunit delta'